MQFFVTLISSISKVIVTEAALYSFSKSKITNVLFDFMVPSCYTHANKEEFGIIEASQKTPL